MQAADDVKFRRAFRNSLGRSRPNFVESKRVSPRRIRRAPERAQTAMRDAHVRRIDVPVDVEVADVAVPLLANVVREPPKRKQVVRLVERKPVFGGKPTSRENSLRNRL